jgi:proteasome lid subunit RPN8/RPN11
VGAVGGEQQNSSDELFTFHQNVYTAMIQHCITQKPLEACGLLSGKENIACSHWPMINIIQSPDEFQMDTKQIEWTFQQMETKGEKLVGIYHSHPTTAPFPSPYDVIHAHYPEATYVIVSLSQIKPEVACFHIDQGMVTPVLYTCR